MTRGGSSGSSGREGCVKGLARAADAGGHMGATHGDGKAWRASNTGETFRKES